MLSKQLSRLSKGSFPALMLLFATLYGPPVLADSLAVENFSGTRVGFVPSEDVFNITLRVTGPENFAAQVFSRQGMPSLDLSKYGPVHEGFYNYEITAATHALVRATDQQDTGMSDDEVSDYINSGYMNKGVTQTGHFSVVSGEIVIFPDIEETE